PYLRAVRVYDVATGAVRHTIFDMAYRTVGTPPGNVSTVLETAGVLADTTSLFNMTSPPGVMAFSADGTRLVTPALTSALVWDLTRIDADGDVK
ncbi:MAG: hypothetical protein ACRC7O_00920, partial [Fimbriiglobus sp.]